MLPGLNSTLTSTCNTRVRHGQRDAARREQEHLAAAAARAEQAGEAQRQETTALHQRLVALEREVLREKKENARLRARAARDPRGEEAAAATGGGGDADEEWGEYFEWGDVERLQKEVERLRGEGRRAAVEGAGICMRVCMHAHVRACVRACMHVLAVCVCKRATCTHACTHTCASADMHTCSHANAELTAALEASKRDAAALEKAAAFLMSPSHQSGRMKLAEELDAALRRGAALAEEVAAEREGRVDLHARLTETEQELTATKAQLKAEADAGWQAGAAHELALAAQRAALTGEADALVLAHAEQVEELRQALEGKGEEVARCELALQESQEREREGVRALSSLQRRLAERSAQVDAAQRQYSKYADCRAGLDEASAALARERYALERARVEARQMGDTHEREKAQLRAQLKAEGDEALRRAGEEHARELCALRAQQTSTSPVCLCGGCLHVCVCVCVCVCVFIHPIYKYIHLHTGARNLRPTGQKHANRAGGGTKHIASGPGV